VIRTGTSSHDTERFRPLIPVRSVDCQELLPHRIGERRHEVNTALINNEVEEVAALQRNGEGSDNSLR
jgi:hypothetical protein